MNRSQRTILWMTATLPVALMLAALVRGVYRDYLAWTEISPRIAKQVEEATRFYQVSPTGATLGNDATVLRNMAAAIRTRASLSGLELSSNPDYGLNQTLSGLPPEGEWPAPKIMDSILEHAQPFFAKIDELISRSEVPYDLSTLLQQESPVLRLRFYAALQRNDSEELHRSLQTFAAMLRQPHTAPDAFSQESYVKTVSLPTYYLVLDFLQNYAEPDQARFAGVLAEILEPVDVEKRLRAAHEAMPIMMLNRFDPTQFVNRNELPGSRFDSGVDWMNFKAAMAALDSPATIQTLEQLPNSLRQWRDPETRIEENLFSLSPRRIQTTFNQQGAFFLGMAISYWRLEDARRVLLLGLAARLYRAEHGQWPQGIKELCVDNVIPESLRKHLVPTDLEGKPLNTEKLVREAEDGFYINSSSQAWNIQTKETFSFTRIVLTSASVK